MAENIKIQFTEEQRRIVYHDGAQIVVAGAGTGKTETLTHHIMHLLLEKKYALHEIVAITFTEKAAAEMRERIYKELSVKVLSATGDEKKRLDNLRNNFSAQNRITTIDGFNASLLAEYPEFSPLPADYEIVDNYTSYLLRVETHRQFLKELQNDAARWNVFLQLHEQMAQASIFSKLEILATYPEDDLREMQREISRQDFVNTVRRLAGEAQVLAWKEYVVSIPADLNSDVREQLTNHIDVDSLLTAEGKFRKAAMKKDAYLATVAEKWPAQAVFAYKSWKKCCKNWCDKENSANIVLNEETLEYDWKIHLISRQLADLALVYKRILRQRIRETGRARFNDVAEAVLEMLHDNPKVCAEVRGGIKHILLDEFQDTSAPQWELVKLLRSENNVMLVGDPKQSIYRFRGGDVTLFETIRHSEFTIHQQRELTVSQRSCPRLIQFFNELFATVLSTQEKRPIYEAAHQELRIPERKRDMTDGGFTWIHTEYERGFGSIGERTRALDALAAFLQCLQEDARTINQREKAGDIVTEEVLLMPQYQNIARAIARGEEGTVGVLCSSHSYKSACEHALRKRGVQFTSYHSQGFYDSMPVLLAINLARFFYDETDNTALAGILRSPLCGVSDVTLAKIFLQNSALWEALTDDASDNITENIANFTREECELLRVVRDNLQAWRSFARVSPFSNVMQKIWDDSWLPFYFRMEDDSDQHQENFTKLIDILRDAQRNREYGLAEIAAFLETLRNDKETRESQADLPDSGSIQLMTLHASKGLGFAMTILAQTDKSERSDSKSVRVDTMDSNGQKYFCISLGEDKKAVLWDILGFRDKAQSRAEVKRELYVTCTRAKEHFVIIPSGGGDWQKWTEPLRKEYARYEYTLDELQAMTCTLALPASSERVHLREMQQPLDGTILPVELSVSQLLGDIFPQNGGDEEVHIDFKESPSSAEDELIPDELPQGAKNRGSLIHRLLEWNDKSTFTAVQNLMTYESLPLADAEDVANLVHSAQNVLHGLPLLHAAALHETPFTLSHFELQKYFQQRSLPYHLPHQLRIWLASRQPHWCNGIIDYMAPLTEGGYAILDFKTHWNPAVRKSQLAKERVKMQLQIYAIAAREMGLEVKKLYALRIYGVEGDVELEEFAI